MALAALDFLAGVKAARPAVPGGFHRLAVDDAHRGARLSPCLFARLHDQGVVDARKNAATRPGVEITLHGRIGRELLGQLPPWAAGRRHVQDRVHDRPQLRRVRAAEA